MTMPGRAEPALAGPGVDEGLGPAAADLVGSSPSMVVTPRPATRRTGVTQETRGEPSTHTVQQPHWPWGLQPSLGDRHPSCSRRASRSVPPVVVDRDRAAVELEVDRHDLAGVTAAGRRAQRRGLS